MIKYLDYIIYWAIVLIPFSMAISPAPMNVFMGFLIAAFLAKKILKKEWLFQKNAISIQLLLLFIVSCLSVINTVCLKDSLRGGVFRLLQYITIFFILTQEIKDKKHLRIIFFSLLAGVLLASTDAIFQVFTGKDFIRGYSVIVNLGFVRATASFKDANLLGIYLSALAPIFWGFALFYTTPPQNPRPFRAGDEGGFSIPPLGTPGLASGGLHLKRGKRLVMFFFSLISLIGILITYSRPSLLAAYVVIWFLAIAKKHKGLIAILIIFTLISPFLVPKSFKDWAKNAGYNPVRVMCNDDRIAVYIHSINMIKDHPFIGVGANAFMKSYKKYKNFPEYRNMVTLDEMKAHNNFLHMAGETGLISLAIFIWLLYGLFRESGEIYRKLKDEWLKIFALSLIACVISFLVNGLTESSLYYSRVAGIFWYLCGLILALKKFTTVSS